MYFLKCCFDIQIALRIIEKSEVFTRTKIELTVKIFSQSQDFLSAVFWCPFDRLTVGLENERITVLRVILCTVKLEFWLELERSRSWFIQRRVTVECYHERGIGGGHNNTSRSFSNSTFDHGEYKHGQRLLFNFTVLELHIEGGVGWLCRLWGWNSNPSLWMPIVTRSRCHTLVACDRSHLLSFLFRHCFIYLSASSFRNQKEAFGFQWTCEERRSSPVGAMGVGRFVLR